MSFEKLNILPAIIKEVKSKGYFHPTPFQIEAIPTILQNKDIVGIVKAGSGKTDTISIPILHQIIKRDKGYKTDRKIRALVITSNKKKAIRIDKSFFAYGKRAGVKTVAVFEDDHHKKKMSIIEHGVNVLIGTPRRITKLLDQGVINISEVKVFVVDELGYMLSRSEKQRLQTIENKLPKERQTLVFSMTKNKDVEAAAQEYANNPKYIEVSNPTIKSTKIAQELYYTDRKTKEDLLMHILTEKKITSGLLFTRTKKGTSMVVDLLSRKNIKAINLSESNSEEDNKKLVETFEKEKQGILVTTDVSSRNLSINGLVHLINYDLTKLSISYLHRLSYLDDEGIAISIAEPEENHFVRVLEKINGVSFKKVDGHPFPQSNIEESRKRDKGKDKRRPDKKKGRKKDRMRDRGSTELPAGLKKKMMWPLG